MRKEIELLGCRHCIHGPSCRPLSALKHRGLDCLTSHGITFKCPRLKPRATEHLTHLKGDVLPSVASNMIHTSSTVNSDIFEISNTVLNPSRMASTCFFTEVPRVASTTSCKVVSFVCLNTVKSNLEVFFQVVYGHVDTGPFCLEQELRKSGKSKVETKVLDLSTIESEGCNRALLLSGSLLR